MSYDHPSTGEIMIVCPCCRRHVNEAEARCPFCACDQPAKRRASYLAIAALGAGMVATQGCYGGPPPRWDETRPRQPAQNTAPVDTTEKPR